MTDITKGPLTVENLIKTTEHLESLTNGLTINQYSPDLNDIPEEPSQRFMDTIYLLF